MSRNDISEEPFKISFEISRGAVQRTHILPSKLLDIFTLASSPRDSAQNCCRYSTSNTFPFVRQASLRDSPARRTGDRLAPNLHLRCLAQPRNVWVGRSLEPAPRQGQDSWPGCTATIKAFSIGQKEFVTGHISICPPEPKQRSQVARLRPQCPQDPNGGRSLPGHDLNAPRAHKEDHSLPGYDLDAPRTQTEVATCQATNSTPQNQTEIGQNDPNLELNILQIRLRATNNKKRQR
ncbi:hypothetical protein B0H14DRAFT_2587612 [Mycena olivaceomarginata]|nr:hypothetical protein B0H14DRAFT_2587612 [Mycena olivaceomarginata]